MTSLDCLQIPSKNYLTTTGSTYAFYFTTVRCETYSTTEISVRVNFTTVQSLLKLEPTRMPPVQVMIGHSNHTDISSAIIRRTEVPVLLMPGINILGFAHQYKVRLFRNPGLSTLGLFAVCNLQGDINP